jgi:hypothetical protein
LLTEKSVSYQTRVIKKRRKKPPSYIVTIFGESPCL